MAFLNGVKQVWESRTTGGTLAGMTLSVGFFQLFDGQAGWAAVNLVTGTLLFAVTLYREIRCG